MTYIYFIYDLFYEVFFGDQVTWFSTPEDGQEYPRHYSMINGMEYPCKKIDKGLSFSQLVQDPDFITACLDPKKRSFASLKRDYSLSKDNSIKKACLIIRNKEKTVESIDESIKLVEPLLQLMKESNPDSFFYKFNVEENTGVFKNLVFTLPGANHFYKNLKQVLVPIIILR